MHRTVTNALPAQLQSMQAFVLAGVCTCELGLCFFFIRVKEHRISFVMQITETKAS